MSSMDLTNDKYVKKHHAAIHSSSQLTLLQRKLANCLLFKAYNNLLTEDYHDISIQELMKLMEIKTNSYDKLRESVLKLMSTVIEWNVLGKDDVNGEGATEIWKASTLLSSVQIQGTQIRYEYSKTLRNLLYRPSGYTRIKLSMQNKFRSAYSLAMYENCLRFSNVGSTGWLSIETFRKIMGVKKDQYKIFRDLNRRVLGPAVDEINEISDIKIDYQLQKINNSPAKIKLIISKNSSNNNSLLLQYNSEVTFDEPEENEILINLIKLGFPNDLARKTLKQYGPKIVQEKINFVLLYPGVVKNPVGILRKALEKNYSIIAKQGSLESRTSSDVQDEEKIMKEKNDFERKKKQYNAYVDDAYRNWIGDLSKIEREVVRSELKLCLSAGSHVMPKTKNIIETIDNDTLFENLSVFTALKIFINKFSAEAKTRIDCLNDIRIMTFEEFLEK